ncbi:unnamed protein product [Malus baccata var. baccata]
MFGSGSSEVRTPIFSGENYEFWRIKMVMIFKSLGLWNLVDKGITTLDSKKKKEAEGSSDDAVDEEMTTVFMKDANALGIIQNVVSDQIFPRIANADSAKMAWDLLFGEYHGGDQVRSVKLQNLRWEFEYARMRDDESLSSYLKRLNELINQMRTFGESLSNKRLVQKVLIRLSKLYDSICLVIKNTKCLETVELQEVVAILKSQEQQFDLHNVDTTKKTFASFSVSPKRQNRSETKSGPSNLRRIGPSNLRRIGVLRRRNGIQSLSFNKNLSIVLHQIHISHSQWVMRVPNHSVEYALSSILVSVDIRGSPNAIIVISLVTGLENALQERWCKRQILECSNHMTGNANLLVDIRTNVAGKVQMPTGALVNVAGMGSLEIDINKGKKYIREVMHLP